MARSVLAMSTRIFRTAVTPLLWAVAVLSLFLACSAFSASPVAAQTSAGAVAGRVTDAASGAPLVGADVALVERYFTSVGVISGGVFFKRLSDYIYPFRVLEAAFGDEYEITQPRNGDSASLWGLELAFQNQLMMFGVKMNF